MANFKTIFKGYCKKNVFLFFLLGLSCAVPFNLVGNTLIVRSKESGLDLKTLGFFSFVLLPFSFKFLWAPIIDAVHLPILSKFGAKKAWGIVFQILLFTCIYLLSFVSPSQDTLLLFILSFFLSFCAASQDIIVDALRIDTLKDDDLKEGSSLYQLGYRMGLLTTGAGIIALSLHVSWRICYQISALLVLIGFFALLLLDEPKQALQRNLNFRNLVLEPFSDFIFRHRNWFKLLSFIVLYKVCNAILGRMAYPFYMEVGFSKEQIALVSSTLGTFITMLGVFLGGLLMVKRGYLKSMMILGCVEILTSFAFALLAFIGPNLIVFSAVVIFDNIVGGMGGAVFVAFLSSLCSRSYSATQYALLTSLTMIALSFLSASSGVLANYCGWVNFFVLTGFMMLPALFLLSKMGQEQK